MSDRKEYTLRRDMGGASGAIYLKSDRMWTGDIEKAHWMTYSTALGEFYKRVVSNYPSVGTVAEHGLVVVYRQWVSNPVIEPIVLI